MSLVPCFSDKIQSDLSLTINGSMRVYKFFDLGQLGTEYNDGVHIELPRSFSIGVIGHYPVVFDYIMTFPLGYNCNLVAA